MTVQKRTRAVQVHTITPGSIKRPLWPAPGYNIADELTDPTDWSINPDGIYPSGGPPLPPAPTLKTKAELDKVKAQAAARYTALGIDLMAEIGLTEPTIIAKALNGHAGRRRDGSITIKCPWPTSTRRRLYIAAHEVAHVHLHFNGTRKPRHVEEMEAELWAHRWLREHGVPVPRKETRRAKRYVYHQITQALKNGPRKIDPAAVRFAGGKNPCTNQGGTS